jgi:homoprotocatechuate degradation regulator HpaR
MASSPKAVFPDFEHSLPMLLLKAREAVMARFRPMLREVGLTEQQWRVIRALSEVEEQDAGELASVSYILSPSLTRINQRLEARGLIERQPDEADQRRSLLSLTGEGHKLFNKVRPLSRDIYAEIASELGADRLSGLYNILEEVEQRLLAGPADPERGRPRK